MKYIKLSGELFLTGPGGITRVEALGDYDPQRKGNNKTLVHGTGFKAVVEESVDQVAEQLGLKTEDGPSTGILMSPPNYGEKCNTCDKTISTNASTYGWCGECIPF